MSLRILVLIVFALLAFAANSLLCRLALVNGVIDPAAFTAIRLLSGAFALLVIVSVTHKRKFKVLSSGSWQGSCFLFLYAVCFSFAYVELGAGAGALLLFGAVQLSMFLLSIIRGHRFTKIEVIGALTAFSGLLYFVYPHIISPDWTYATLMIIAGIAWGLYTLAGQASSSPLFDTSSNFIRAVPLTLILVLFFHHRIAFTVDGVILAMTSGAIASGVGYSIWYKVLPYLKSSSAAVSQLSVPIIAAIGGLLFLSEPISARLLIGGSVVFIGILMVIFSRSIDPK